MALPSRCEFHRVALDEDLVSCRGDVIWRRATGRYLQLTPQQAATLRTVRDADGHRLQELELDDIGNLVLDELVRAGLVRVWDERLGLRVPYPLVLQVVIANWFSRALLRLAGRSLLRRIVDVEPQPAPEETVWAGLHIERLLAAQRIATAFPAVSGSCLPVALSMYLMLRLRNEHPRLRLGATSVPFAAHAWVEVRGQRLDPSSTVFPGSHFQSEGTAAIAR